jgi:hypothetical protein
VFQLTPEVIEVNGRKRVKITLRQGDHVVDADVIDPLNANNRRKVAQRLAERSGDRHATERIEQALLQCVDLLVDDPKPKEDDQKFTGPMTLVRSEQFITRHVRGMSVPEVVIRNGMPEARWRLYLAWDDGKRTSQVLTTRVEHSVAPGPTEAEKKGDSHHFPGTLWIYPLPPDPTIPLSVHWTEASREKWLKGYDPNPVELFDRLCAAFEDYLDLPCDAETNVSPLAQLLALWTMLTYVYTAWDAVPYLYIGGPAGSGKTRVFELLSRLVYRGFSSSNLSAPALFRTLHDRGGTLLLDEAERLSENSTEVGELRSILLAGYKRGGKATRLESAGESFQMSEFAVYTPKAIACINALTGPLATRCIPVQMFRAPPDSPKPRRRIDENPQRWSDLRDDLHCLALGELGRHAPLLSVTPDACPLGGRQYELWQPILSIADWLDSLSSRQMTKRLADLARQLVIENQEEFVSETDLILLRVLTEQLLRDREPSCDDILQKAKMVHEPSFRHMTPRSVAVILKRFGLTTVRESKRRFFRDPELEQLKRIERHYSIELYTSGQEPTLLVGRRY